MILHSLFLWEVHVSASKLRVRKDSLTDTNGVVISVRERYHISVFRFFLTKLSSNIKSTCNLYLLIKYEVTLIQILQAIYSQIYRTNSTTPNIRNTNYDSKLIKLL